MEKKQGIIEVGKESLSMAEILFNKKAEGITKLARDGENWRVTLEVLERKAIPDTQDILSIYELKLTLDVELVEYNRIGMRHRGDMVVEEEFQ